MHKLMTSYLYSLFLNYVTKVMLFFYIQTKNNVFFRDSSNLTYFPLTCTMT